MLLEESSVIFPFPEYKKRHGGKSILINFFKSLGKKYLRVLLFNNLKKFRGHVG